MLELLALLLSAFTSLFKSTERLGATNLSENLILYDQRGLLKGPVPVPDLRFVCGRRYPGAISVSSLKICCRCILGTLAKTGRW